MLNNSNLGIRQLLRIKRFLSTTDYATTAERENTTEEMSAFTDLYGKLFPLADSNFVEKHLLNKEKRIRQRLHEQLLEKKMKFDIQSRSLSKFVDISNHDAAQLVGKHFVIFKCFKTQNWNFIILKR